LKHAPQSRKCTPILLRLGRHQLITRAGMQEVVLQLLLHMLQLLLPSFVFCLSILERLGFARMLLLHWPILMPCCSRLWAASLRSSPN